MKIQTPKTSKNGLNNEQQNRESYITFLPNICNSDEVMYQNNSIVCILGRTSKTAIVHLNYVCLDKIAKNLKTIMYKFRLILRVRMCLFVFFHISSVLRVWLVGKYDFGVNVRKLENYIIGYSFYCEY